MRRLSDILVMTAGILMVVLGVIGLFLPVLQGILFIVIGLSLMSTRGERVRRFLHRLRARIPTLDQALIKWKNRRGSPSP